MIYLVTNNTDFHDCDLYKLISVEKSLELLEPLKLIGFDTETEGLDCHKDKLLSMQFGCFDFQIVVDCITVAPKEYKQLIESPTHLFLGWNLKFDGKFLLTHGIIPNKFYDGFLAERLLYLGWPPGSHPLSLKAAGENYLGVEMDKTIRGEIIYKGLVHEVIEYAANDVKYLEQIILKQREELKKKDLLKAIEVENQFLIPLTYIEWCGVKLDEEKWKRKMIHDSEKEKETFDALNKWFLEEFTISNKELSPSSSVKEIETLRNKYIHKNIQGDLFIGFDDTEKVTLNWNSAQQMIPIFKLFDVDVQVKDKASGDMKDSIDAKVLKGQKKKCSMISKYLEYREAVKVTSTYGENFLKQINPITKRIHTNFQQIGADTTRITSGGTNKSSKDKYINLLNLPRDSETRSCFIAEEGNCWISIDYSGQETYLMASIANDKAILNELINGSGDIHGLTAYMSYKEIPRKTAIKDIKKSYPELRQEAKGIEFAMRLISGTIWRQIVKNRVNC